MAPKPHTIFVTFAAVLVMAVFVAITTWAAVPKSHSDPAALTSARERFTGLPSGRCTERRRLGSAP